MVAYNFSEGFCPECDEVRILPEMHDNGRCGNCGDYARDCVCCSECLECGTDLQFQEGGQI
jgi:hypothetical protein